MQGIKNFLEDFGVVALMETWLEEKNIGKEEAKWSNKYNWHVKAAERAKKRGRAKGGIIVGLRKEIAKGIRIKEGKYFMGICGPGGKKDKRVVNIIVTYFNEGVKKGLIELDKFVDERIPAGEDLIVVGDMNARTGVEQVGKEGNGQLPWKGS